MLRSDVFIDSNLWIYAFLDASNDHEKRETVLSFLKAVRSKSRIIVSVHAVDEMNAPDEMISTQEVREVVFNGVMIEDYPQDRRGHSALLGAETSLCRVVHTVCAPKGGYLAIITAYVPSLEKWEEGLMKRRKK